MPLIYAVRTANPYANPDIRNGVATNFTLPASANFVQQIQTTTANIVVTIPAGRTAQFQNTGTIPYTVNGQSALQEIDPGDTVTFAWDNDTETHAVILGGGVATSPAPELLTISTDTTLTSPKYRQVITATTEALTVTVPAESSYEIFNAGQNSFDLEVTGLSTQIVLPQETIEVTWDADNSQHIVTSQLDATTPDGTVKLAKPDGTVVTFDSDGTINGNGTALVNAITAAIAFPGARIYADPEATYAMPAITEIQSATNMKIYGNGAKLQPRDDIPYYTNIFWIENSSRVVFIGWNADGLAQNYDAWELPTNDPDFSIEAKIVSKNNNPSPQGVTKTSGGRFFTFKNCTNSGMLDCSCEQNSCIIQDAGGFVPAMWSADAVYVTNGKNNYIKRCVFYRPGYSAIHGESDNLLIDNCEVRNAIWHGIVLNSNAAGHTATVSNTTLLMDTQRHLPADCLDLNATIGSPYDRFTLINVSVKTTGHLPGGKEWASGESLSAGQYRFANSKWYYAENGGTTANQPSHATGSASGADGIIWHYVSAFAGMERVKFGACRRCTLENVSIDIAESQYYTSSIYTQTHVDEVYMDKCVLSHAFTQISQETTKTRKVSISKSTIGYRDAIAAVSVKSVDTEVKNCVLHYKSIAVDHSGIIEAGNKLTVEDNILVPFQANSSNAFQGSDWLESGKAGNIRSVRNRLYDSIGDVYYDANVGFTSATTGYYQRTSDSPELRQLMHQNDGGELIYTGVVGGNFYKPSAQAAAPWFNDGSLLVNGRPGLVIRNAAFDPAGSGAAVPHAWQWVAATSSWAALS